MKKKLNSKRVLDGLKLSTDRIFLAERLRKESELVRLESKAVLKEFEEIE